jgi:hypothetical protein
MSRFNRIFWGTYASLLALPMLSADAAPQRDTSLAPIVQELLAPGQDVIEAARGIVISEDRRNVAGRFASCELLDQVVTKPGAPAEASRANPRNVPRETMTIGLRLTQSAAGIAAVEKYATDDTVGWHPTFIESFVTKLHGEPKHPNQMRVVGGSKVEEAGTAPEVTSQATFYPRTDYHEGDTLRINAVTGVETHLMGDMQLTKNSVACGELILRKSADSGELNWAPVRPAA